MRLRLFGRKKKEPQAQVSSYDIFGGFTITKGLAGYEIKWRSPNVTTITVHSPPVIDEDVQTRHEGDRVQVLTTSCKLRITTEQGRTEARVSKI